MDMEIKQVISIESGKPIENISDSSTLLGDLQIDGDDAWSLLEQCNEKFGLDISDFQFNKHFRNEPCFKGLIYFYRKLKYRDEHLASQKIPFTVRRLIDACNKGKW